METINRTWPRKVVISPTFGAGLSTWWHTPLAYDMVEHPTLIEAVMAGDTWDQVQDRLVAAGFDHEMVETLYGGGWKDAMIVTAHEPYIITEYDGSESLQHRSDINWRM